MKRFIISVSVVLLLISTGQVNITQSYMANWWISLACVSMGWTGMLVLFFFLDSKGKNTYSFLLCLAGSAIGLIIGICIGLMLIYPEHNILKFISICVLSAIGFEIYLRITKWNLPII